MTAPVYTAIQIETADVDFRILASPVGRSWTPEVKFAVSSQVSARVNFVWQALWAETTELTPVDQRLWHLATVV